MTLQIPNKSSSTGDMVGRKQSSPKGNRRRSMEHGGAGGYSSQRNASFMPSNPNIASNGEAPEQPKKKLSNKTLGTAATSSSSLLSQRRLYGTDPMRASLGNQKVVLSQRMKVGASQDVKFLQIALKTAHGEISELQTAVARLQNANMVYLAQNRGLAQENQQLIVENKVLKHERQQMELQHGLLNEASPIELRRHDSSPPLEYNTSSIQNIVGPPVDPAPAACVQEQCREKKKKKTLFSAIKHSLSKSLHTGGHHDKRQFNAHVKAAQDELFNLDSTVPTMRENSFQHDSELDDSYRNGQPRRRPSMCQTWHGGDRGAVNASLGDEAQRLRRFLNESQNEAKVSQDGEPAPASPSRRQPERDSIVMSLGTTVVASNKTKQKRRGNSNTLVPRSAGKKNMKLARSIGDRLHLTWHGNGGRRDLSHTLPVEQVQTTTLISACDVVAPSRNSNGNSSSNTPPSPLSVATPPHIKVRRSRSIPNKIVTAGVPPQRSQSARNRPHQMRTTWHGEDRNMLMKRRCSDIKTDVDSEDSNSTVAVVMVENLPFVSDNTMSASISVPAPQVHAQTRIDPSEPTSSAESGSEASTPTPTPTTAVAVAVAVKAQTQAQAATTQQPAPSKPVAVSNIFATSAGGDHTQEERQHENSTLKRCNTLPSSGATQQRRRSTTRRMSADSSVMYSDEDSGATDQCLRRCEMEEYANKRARDKKKKLMRQTWHGEGKMTLSILEGSSSAAAGAAAAAAASSGAGRRPRVEVNDYASLRLTWHGTTRRRHSLASSSASQDAPSTRRRRQSLSSSSSTSDAQHLDMLLLGRGTMHQRVDAQDPSFVSMN